MPLWPLVALHHTVVVVVVVVVDAKRMDGIVIFQVTFRAMPLASRSLLSHTPKDPDILLKDVASSLQEVP